MIKNTFIRRLGLRFDCDFYETKKILLHLNKQNKRRCREEQFYGLFIKFSFLSVTAESISRYLNVYKVFKCNKITFNKIV